MARPKKPPEQHKIESIRIPVTADQKRSIIEAGSGATTGGYTGWARDVLLKAAEAQLRLNKVPRKGESEG